MPFGLVATAPAAVQGAAGMFTPWPRDWRRRLAVIGPGSWWCSARSASASTSWSTRCATTRPSRLRRRASSSTSSRPRRPQDLGFPAFATKNTTRVAGLDPVADAAGVALAVVPLDRGRRGPRRRQPGRGRRLGLGDRRGQPRGAARSRAPILLTGTDDIPDFTAQALSALAPAGSARPTASRSSRSARRPPRRTSRRDASPASTPAEIAAAIDRLRQRLTGDQPQHIVLVELRAAGVRDARRRLGGALGRSGAVRLEEMRRRSRRSPRFGADKRRPGLRARARRR